MNALKAYLMEEFGLNADADEADVRKQAAELLAADALSHDKYLELITPQADQPDPLDKLADALAARLGTADKTANAEVLRAAAAPHDAEFGLRADEQRASSPAPERLFAAAAGGHRAGAPRIKRASESYGATKARKVYPQHFSQRAHGKAHPLAGQDVWFEGNPAYDQSDAERAKSGAWQKWKLGKALGVNLMTDHDADLLMEALETDLWVGDFNGPNGLEEFQKPKQLGELHRKTLLNDATSGGQNLAPYYFDLDLVTYPLLNGELFPFVDLRDLDTSGQVKTPTLQNVTVSAGPAEGDSPGITLQTTTGLAAVLTSDVFNATDAITIGRDFLTDTPLRLQNELMQSYQRVLMNFLDSGIAAGDGSTFILGIFNTSSTNAYTAANGTAGPVKVSDIENMTKALPKQYRDKNAPVVWLATDGQYFRIKSISVSGTDQRLIYGYDLENYMLHSRPFKITNASGVAGSQLAFGRLDKYRMWRRKGMTFETSAEGKTLMLANELLITMRSRWAGQVVDPNAWVLGSNFSLQ